VPRHESKSAQYKFGLSQGLSVLEKHQAVDDGELGVRKPRPHVLKLTVKGRPRGRGLL
jgi:hypothetical protein